MDGFRLIAVVPLNVRAALGGQDAFRGLEDPVGADIPHHGEDHVGGGVEGLVAAVQGLGGDAGDALHGAGHGDTGGTLPVQGLQHPLIDLPLRVILDHADLLSDNALLLGHALVGEVRHRHKGQQLPQILVKMLRAVEVVGRHGIAARMRSGVTCRSSAAISSGVSRRPVAASPR